MAISKVNYGDTTLMDLTGDTVTSDTLLEGVTAHNAAGVQITGTFTPEITRETIDDVAGVYDITWTADGYISKDDGSAKAEQGSSYSDFLEIEPNGKLVISNTMTADNEWNVWYDSSKTFISSFSNATGTVTAPSNAKYFRLSKYTSATLTVIRGNINSRIPTKVSQLTNDSGFLTLSTLPKYNGEVD